MDERKFNSPAENRLTKHFVDPYNEALGADRPDLQVDMVRAMDILEGMIAKLEGEESADGESAELIFDLRTLKAMKIYLVGRSVGDANRIFNMHNNTSARYSAGWYRKKTRDFAEAMASSLIDGPDRDYPREEVDPLTIGDQLGRLESAGYNRGYLQGLSLLCGQYEVSDGKQDIAEKVLVATRKKLYAKIKSSRNGPFKRLSALTGSEPDHRAPKSFEDLVREEMVDNSADDKDAIAVVRSDISEELARLHARELRQSAVG